MTETRQITHRCSECRRVYCSDVREMQKSGQYFTPNDCPNFSHPQYKAGRPGSVLKGARKGDPTEQPQRRKVGRPRKEEVA